MSEADTPNNQSFPEPTDASDETVSDAPEAMETKRKSPIVSLSELADWDAIGRQSSQGEQSEAFEEISDRLESSESEGAKDADWFALAQKMRQRNHRLLDRLTQLKQSLQEKTQELHAQTQQLRDRDSLAIQQAEELNVAQSQLKRLFQTLESSHQAAQRQQILIETLSEQLQSSQERVAQLERECALTQQRYNEQSHQLLQAANTCRELRTRLHRQQRQTLQFKVALEKSLEMSPTSGATAQPPNTQNSIPHPSAVAKAQPIQPWSAELEIDEEKPEIDPLWNRPIRLELFSQPKSESSESPSRDPVESISPDASPAPVPILKRSEETEKAATPVDSPLTASVEKLDTELETEQELLAEMSTLAEAAGLLDEGAEAFTAETTAESADRVEAFGNDEEAPQTAAPEVPDTEIWEEYEDVWAQEAEPDSAKTKDVILPQPNWPSPTLYPLRPPKKRKSLAAIELPSFPRYQSS
jgi:hypothetical protein